MTMTLRAPKMMGSRSQVAAFLEECGDKLTEATVTVNFVDDARGTPSFIDELVRALLVDRDARHLVLQNLGSNMCAIAFESAAHFGCSERLTCS